MSKVRIAELKNGLSRYVAAVRDGAEIVVLDRDTPVARLVPFGPRDARTPGVKDDYWTPDRLAALERQGTIRPAMNAGDMAAPAPRPLPAGTPSVVDLLVQARRESLR